MNYTSGRISYYSKAVKDDSQGCEGCELYKTQDGNTQRIASVIFWDATGQFWIDTHGTTVPLELMEELITEAKGLVKTK